MIDDHTSRWRAAASPGGLIGLLFVILSVMAAVTSFLGITERVPLALPDLLLWFVLAASVAAALLFGFLLWAYLSIGYRLGGECLEITWGFWTERIPLGQIESVVPAEEVIGVERPGWHPFWPGYYVGRRQSPAGQLRIVATLPPRRQVLIRLVDGRQLAISPERPLLFMEELSRWRSARVRSSQPMPAEANESTAQRFVDAGWTVEYSAIDPAADAEVASTATAGESDVAEPPLTRVYRSQPSATSPLLRPILMRDPVSLSLIVLGIVGAATMALYILVQFQDVPQSLTLHWNVDGLPGRVGEPREIWILPTIAVLVLIANLGLAWSIALFDRFAARLMLSSTLFVQVVTWVGLIMILH